METSHTSVIGNLSYTSNAHKWEYDITTKQPVFVKNSVKMVYLNDPTTKPPTPYRIGYLVGTMQKSNLDNKEWQQVIKKKKSLEGNLPSCWHQHCQMNPQLQSRYTAKKLIRCLKVLNSKVCYSVVRATLRLTYHL